MSEIVFYSTVKYGRTKSVFENNVLAVSLKCNNRCNSHWIIYKKAWQYIKSA